jgi:hypothetical protein
MNVRFINQYLRGFTKEIIFSQKLLGFQAASANPGRIFRLNFVMP